MARPATRARTHTGLYATLFEREELAARNGWRVIEPSGKGYTGNPARLAGLPRAPVNVRQDRAGSWESRARRAASC